MLLLIFFGSALIYSIESFKTTPSPLERLAHSSAKNDEQPVAIEGRFIVVEGNADHLFRPSDFIKEDAVQLGEGDTKDTKTTHEVSRRYDRVNALLPVSSNHRRSLQLSPK